MSGHYRPNGPPAHDLDAEAAERVDQAITARALVRGVLPARLPYVDPHPTGRINLALLADDDAQRATIVPPSPEPSLADLGRRLAGRLSDLHAARVRLSAAALEAGDPAPVAALALWARGRAWEEALPLSRSLLEHGAPCPLDVATLLVQLEAHGDTAADDEGMAGQLLEWVAQLEDGARATEPGPAPV